MIAGVPQTGVRIGGGGIQPFGVGMDVMVNEGGANRGIAADVPT